MPAPADMLPAHPSCRMLSALTFGQIWSSLPPTDKDQPLEPLELFAHRACPPCLPPPAFLSLQGLLDDKSVLQHACLL